MQLPRSITSALEAGRSLPTGAVVYFLRLRSGQLYIGSSTNLAQRLADHVSGRACLTTKVDAPAALLRVELSQAFPDARRREAQLKRWSRAKKEALIRGAFDQLSALSRSREPTQRPAKGSEA